MKELSLQYIVREPNTITENTSLLILLHDYGSNEEDLFSFATELPDDLLIVSARAPQDLSSGSFSWYTIYFNTGEGKFSDIPEAIEARETISTFIDRHGVEKPFIQKSILPQTFESITGQNANLAIAIGLALVGFFLIIIMDKYSPESKA